MPSDRPNRKIVWYAKGGGIARSGPHDDQIAAAAAMTLCARPHQVLPDGRVILPRPANTKPDDFATWPEYADE